MTPFMKKLAALVFFELMFYFPATTNAQIKLLQVYPSGHNARVLAEAIHSYQSLGNPQLNVDVEVITIEQFNGITSLDQEVTVLYCSLLMYVYILCQNLL
jgi:hypothetical protein